MERAVDGNSAYFNGRGRPFLEEDLKEPDDVKRVVFGDEQDAKPVSYG
jgi:hypothetical protein